MTKAFNCDVEAGKGGGERKEMESRGIVD